MQYVSLYICGNCAIRKLVYLWNLCSYINLLYFLYSFSKRKGKMRLILFTLLASLAIVKGDIFGISKNLLGNILNTANKLLEGFGDKKPLESICGKYECPTYTVKFKKAHYELRCYENAHWVSVKSDHSLSRGKRADSTK